MPLMSKVIRNAGYVLLAAGGLMMLASFAGFVMMDSFDKFQVTLLDARSYVAVAPGIINDFAGLVDREAGALVGLRGPNAPSNNYFAALALRVQFLAPT
jgi:hypothetical protein